MENYLKKHPVLSTIWGLLAFAFFSFPMWLATVWPLFSKKPFPDWLSENQGSLLSMAPLTQITIMGALSMVVVGFFFYTIRAVRGKPLIGVGDHMIPDYRRWKSEQQVLIRDKKFTNETVEIDGKAFENCGFENVTFLYHGLAPFRVAANCAIEPDSLMLKTDNQAAKGFLSLVKKFEELGRKSGRKHSVIYAGMNEDGHMFPFQTEHFVPDVMTSTPRPRVEIVGCYTPDAGGIFEGFVLSNLGEPAYNIEIDPVQIGSVRLEVVRGLQRLAKEDGKKVCSFETDGTSERVFDVMRHQNVEAIEVVFRYQDWQLAQWYEGRCKIARDVLAKGGLTFTHLGQRAIRRPQQ